MPRGKKVVRSAPRPLWHMRLPRRGAVHAMVGERGRHLNRLPVFETSALALIRRHQDALRAAPSWVARVKDKEHC